MDWNTITAFGAFFALLVVARAYAPLLAGKNDPFVSHIARAAVWWAVATVIRFGHWDIANTLLTNFVGREAWFAYRDFFNGVQYNIVPNAMKIWGAWHLLKAKWCLIPEEQRASETWISAIWYPAKRCRPINRIWGKQ